MFSKDLLIEKNKIKNLPEQKTKKLKTQKSDRINNLCESEQINFFAEIIVNNLFKNYSYES